MRTRTLRRTNPLLMALAAGLVGFSWTTPAAPRVGDLEGEGILATLGCIGCAAGGLYALSTGGLGFILWAGWTQAGSAAVVTCAAACIAAVTE